MTARENYRSLSNSLLIGNVDNLPSRGLLKQMLLLENTPKGSGLVVGEEPDAGTFRNKQPGRCYNFDGTDDHFSAGVNPIRYGDFTIAFWANPDHQSINAVFGCGDAYLVGGKGMVSYYNDGTFIFYLNGADGFGMSYAPFSSGVWAHIAITYNATTGAVACYKDGVLLRSDIGTTNIDRLYYPFYIGKYGEAGYFFDGKLFDWRLYDSLLSAAEVSELVSLKASALPTKPTVRHYKLDGQQPLKAFDSSVNKAHGALTGVNATVGNFFYEGADVPFSWQNDKGYSRRTNYVPLDTFHSSVWGEAGATSLQNVIEAPDGTMTGHKIVPVATSGYHVISLGASTTSGLVWTAEVDYKAAQYSVGFLTDANSGQVAAVFNLATQTVTKLNCMGATITPLGNGWFRCRAWGIVTTTYAYITCGGAPQVSDVTIYGGNFTPPSGEGIYAANPRLYPGMPDDRGPSKTSGIAAIGPIPRDESDKSKDVFGNALQYAGKCPNNAQAVDGHCVTFDGATSVDRVTVPDSDLLTFNNGGTSDRPFSVACWMKKVGGTAAGASLLVKTDGSVTEWNFGYYNNDVCILMNDVNGYYLFPYAANAITSDTWHHVTFTYDGRKLWTGIKIYVDGVQRVTTNSSYETYSGMINRAVPLMMGVYTGNYGGPMTGSMCDARIYDRVLTDDEIKHVAGQVGTDPGQTNLVAHWPMSEGGLKRIHDIGPNALQGQLTATLPNAWNVKQSKYHHNLSKGYNDALIITNLGGGAGWSAEESWIDVYNPLVGDFDMEFSDDATSLTVTGFQTENYLTNSQYGLLDIGAQFNNSASLRIWHDGSITDLACSGFLPGSRIKLARRGSNCLVYLNGAYIGSVACSSGTMYAAGTFSSTAGEPLAIYRINGIVPKALVIGVGAPKLSRKWVKVPARHDGLIDANGYPVLLEAGPHHNNAESNLDLSQAIAHPGSTSLIKKWAPNLLRSGHDLSTNDWTDVTAAVTRISDKEFDPETGYASATLIKEAATYEFHYLGQNVVLPPGNYVLEATVKAAGRNWFNIHLNATTPHYAYFNPSTKTIGQTSGCTAELEDLGNGFILARIRVTTTAPSVYANLAMAEVNGNGYYTGDGTSGVYIGRFSLYPAAPTYQRDHTLDSRPHRADRLASYHQILAGARSVSVQKFTQTQAVN